MSLVVNYKEECCITSVSRVMYAALRVVQIAEDGSFSAFPLLVAVHAKKTEIQMLGAL